jgi:hypothetical protein
MNTARTRRLARLAHWRSTLFTVAASASAVLSVAQTAEARVTRFVVEERVPFAPGTEWGTAGPYERLKGTAFMEVDPADPLNAVIVNLDRAPRNARGMVEFSAPFFILKPADMRRGNGKIWHGINNRSNCIELGFRAFPFRATTCNVLQAEDVGADHPILQEGFAFVDAGWHADALPDPTGARLVPSFPVATQADGSPIVGRVRIEHVPIGDASFTRPLVFENGSSGTAPSRTWRPYEPVSTDTAQATLTVRERADAPPVPIPSDRWAFGRCPTGQASLVPTTGDLCLFDGFQPTRLYELTYTAKNPIVMGLAYAVTRDVASFLRYRTQDDAGNPNPLALSSSELGIRRAYSSGTSSTGMYQREFLYLGFNEDEARRRVFDAATIYSGGAYRLFANVQFAHPTFYSRQDANRDYVSNALPPFAFAVSTDPVTGIRDGILKRPSTDPLVMQIDEELVFWQWKASLNVHDGRGNPVPVPDTVRLYLQAGYGHIGGAGLLAPAATVAQCRDPATGVANNQASTGLTSRALVRVIDDWADRGVPPPPSNYPRVEDGTLVTLDEYRAQYPAIRGLELPRALNELRVLNFGPLFTPQGGVQTLLPPLQGERYIVMVPRADTDGIAKAGIQTMMTRVPLGTNAGWNVRAGTRAPDLCGLNGAFLPFARTASDRAGSGDPRRSLAERYADANSLSDAVRRASDELVRERFMTKEDADKFLSGASAGDLLR